MNDGSSGTDWYHRAAARTWSAQPLTGSPGEFHRSLPFYAPTPLTELPVVAEELDVARVFVKDESSRLGLPSFKILGASWAVACELADRLGTDDRSVAGLRRCLAGSGMSLVAATDGNHGRAVARMAALLGLSARISVPTGVSTTAREAIAAEGAELVEYDLSYDEVVQRVASTVTADQVLIQDTSWPGYETVPRRIVDGYDTMLDEVDHQLRENGVAGADLVVVPAGVGSFAQAVVAHYRRAGDRPAVLAVEPDTAASLTTALRSGRIRSVPTGDTVMTGLNCGTVSEIAWPVLSGGLDAAVTVTDEQALAALADLHRLEVDAGPCGAATLAAGRAVLGHPARRNLLDLSPDAVVVLLSTEGSAANPKVDLP